MAVGETPSVSQSLPTGSPRGKAPRSRHLSTCHTPPAWKSPSTPANSTRPCGPSGGGGWRKYHGGLSITHNTSAPVRAEVVRRRQPGQRSPAGPSPTPGSPPSWRRPPGSSPARPGPVVGTMMLGPTLSNRNLPRGQKRRPTGNAREHLKIVNVATAHHGQPQRPCRDEQQAGSPGEPEHCPAHQGEE